MICCDREKMKTINSVSIFMNYPLFEKGDSFHQYFYDKLISTFNLKFSDLSISIKNLNQQQKTIK